MVSVVIPAYNEEKTIVACLDAFVTQITGEKFEVIVVNNNSTDRTEEVAKTYKNKLDLQVVLQKEKGRGAARYLGFKEAKGEIILSTDADAVVPPDWIETLVTALKESDAVAVSGICMINDCGGFRNAAFNFFQPLGTRGYRLFLGHYWLAGFGFAIYKGIYDKSGGFNPKLNGLEDIDLGFRVCKLGEIKLITRAPVVFSGRRFQKGLLRGYLVYFKSFIDYYVYKKKRIVLSDIR